MNQFRGVAPGYGQKAAAQLEADVKNGAIGFKIFKETGMDTTKADGSRLKINDPELAPIWETAARLNIPVIIHTAEPQEFFKPLDMHNERWLELALFANRRRYLVPVSFETLSAERDDLFAKHPKTRFISAHFGWHANDLGHAAKLLDANPNVVLELAAILYDLGRQPRAAHDFFVKYQDRILFGKDTYAPTEFPYYWRVLETRDEYFDYYRDYHAFWKMYGMGLPDAVLRKVYYQNARRVTPGLPHCPCDRGRHHPLDAEVRHEIAVVLLHVPGVHHQRQRAGALPMPNGNSTSRPPACRRARCTPRRSRRSTRRAP